MRRGKPMFCCVHQSDHLKTDADPNGLCRFIGTRILSGAVLEKLHTNNIPFAQIEDAVAAVLHIASDVSINGTSTLR